MNKVDAMVIEHDWAICLEVPCIVTRVGSAQPEVVVSLGRLTKMEVNRPLVQR